MRVLITGAFGFIGRHLLLRLFEESDIEIFLLDREKYVPSTFFPHQASGRSVSGIIQADLRDIGRLKRYLADIQPDIIFHLAAAGVGDPFLAVADALNHNLHGTLNLLQAAFSGGLTHHQPQKIIISRTPGEYSAMNTYAASKAAAWQFCTMYARTRGWPIVAGAVYQAYGPGQPAQRLLPAAIIAALNGQDFPMTAGKQQKDWIYVTDVIAGFMALYAAEVAPGTTVDLGSGQLTSVAEVAQQVYAIVGGPGRPLLGALPSRPGEEEQQLADVNQTYDLIKWRSKTPLALGLRQTINYFANPQK